MKDFDYIAPTKIYFGKNKEYNIGEYIKEYGFKKVLVHYGKNSIKKNGLYSIVINSLTKNNIDYVELGGVRPNPEVKLVKEGIEICKNNNVDFILAIGGGSVLDSSKLISQGVFYEGDPYDISLKKVTVNKHLPVGSILTIAASGSEMSASCVISNDELKLKKGFLSENNRPLFVIEDPLLTYSLPEKQLGYGIVDIISHTFERYFNKSEKIEFADYIAEGLIKSVIDSAEQLLVDKEDYNARATIMLASSYSHNGLTNLGKQGLMPIHQLEHEVSGLHDGIPHGAGLAVLIPAWMKCVYEYDKDKFVKFSKNVMLISEYESEEELIKKGIDKLQDLFIRLGMPKNLSELGVKKEDIELMANRLTNNNTNVFPSNVPLTKELIIKIYNICLGE